MIPMSLFKCQYLLTLVGEGVWQLGDVFHCWMYGCVGAVSKHGITEESSTIAPVVLPVNAEQQQLSRAIILTLSVTALVFIPIILSLLIAICVREYCRRGESALLHLYIL